MATVTDLENAIRRVLNTGTAKGQVSWASTNKATLAAIQHVANLINQQVIPLLKAVAVAQNNGDAAPAPEQAEPAADSLDALATYDSDAIDEDLEHAEDAGTQQLAQAGTDDERLAIEASFLIETDNGAHGDEEEVSQAPEVLDDNS